MLLDKNIDYVFPEKLSIAGLILVTTGMKLLLKPLECILAVYYSHVMICDSGATWF